MHEVKKIKKVSSTWPKDFTAVPLVHYQVTDNSGGIYTDQGESTSMVQISIHIFTETLTEGIEIAGIVNEKIQALGWERVGFSQASEKYQHITLMFMAEIDTETNTHFYT